MRRYRPTAVTSGLATAQIRSFRATIAGQKLVLEAKLVFDVQDAAELAGLCCDEAGACYDGGGSNAVYQLLMSLGHSLWPARRTESLRHAASG